MKIKCIFFIESCSGDDQWILNTWLIHRNKVWSDPLLVWANKTESSPRSRCEETISIRGNGPYFLTSLRAHIREPFMWRYILTFVNDYHSMIFMIILHSENKVESHPEWIIIMQRDSKICLSSKILEIMLVIRSHNSGHEGRNTGPGGDPIKRPAYNLYKIT